MEVKLSTEDMIEADSTIGPAHNTEATDQVGEVVIEEVGDGHVGEGASGYQCQIFSIGLCTFGDKQKSVLFLDQFVILRPQRARIFALLVVQPIVAEIVVLRCVSLDVRFGTLVEWNPNVTHLKTNKGVGNNVINFGVAVHTGDADYLLTELFGQVNDKQQELGIIAPCVHVDYEL